MGFPKEEYWSGMPFPPLADLPDPEIKHASPVALALTGRFFTIEPSGKPLQRIKKKRVSKHFPQVPEHIIAKMLKIKHKEKNLEGSQSKKKHTYKGKTSAKFSSETMQNSNVTSSESQKTKTWQLRFSTQ